MKFWSETEHPNVGKIVVQKRSKRNTLFKGPKWRKFKGPNIFFEVQKLLALEHDYEFDK